MGKVQISICHKQKIPQNNVGKSKPTKICEVQRKLHFLVVRQKPHSSRTCEASSQIPKEPLDYRLARGTMAICGTIKKTKCCCPPGYLSITITCSSHLLPYSKLPQLIGFLSPPRTLLLQLC